MAFHPRERRGYGRRQFIRLSAYGAAAAGLGPTLLTACGRDDDDQSSATSGSSAPGSSRAGGTCPLLRSRGAARHLRATALEIVSR